MSINKKTYYHLKLVEKILRRVFLNLYIIEKLNWRAIPEKDTFLKKLHYIQNCLKINFCLETMKNKFLQERRAWCQDLFSVLKLIFKNRKKCKLKGEILNTANVWKREGHFQDCIFPPPFLTTTTTIHILFQVAYRGAGGSHSSISSFLRLAAIVSLFQKKNETKRNKKHAMIL